MKKKILGLLLIGAMTLGSTFTSFAGWEQIDGGWKYKDNTTGTYTMSGWKLIDEKWYYFDAAAKMMTGWQFIDENWYLLDSSGAMKTGWVTESDGKRYYLFSDGRMATGVQTIEGVEHLFLTNGEWVEVAGSSSETESHTENNTTSSGGFGGMMTGTPGHGDTTGLPDMY